MTTGDERPFDETRPDTSETAKLPGQTTPEPVPAAFAPPAGWASGTDPDWDPAAGPTLPGDQVAFGSPPRQRSWGLIGVAAGVVLALLVGGVVFAVGKLSGGGTQPEEIVPASAFAFAKLDLDPAAGQKLAVRQFLEHFPDAAEALGDNEDVREVIFGQIASDAGLSYPDDVEPWLGDRFAAAAIPGPLGQEPDFAIYVQADESDQAADALAEMFADGGDSAAVGFRRGYAIVSQDQEMLDRVEEAANEGALSAESEFDADMAGLGGDEVASAWVDMRALLGAVESSVPGGFAALPAEQRQAFDAFQGRVAITARFSDDYAEIFGRTVGFDATEGLDASAKPVGPVMRNLPPNTGAALAVSGFASSIENEWPGMIDAFDDASGASQFDALVADWEARYGLKLPEDLATLLGEPTLFAFDGDSFDAQLPLFGMRAVTDAAAAEAVVQKLLSVLEFEFGVDVAELPVHWTAAGDSLYVTTDPSYTEALQQGGTVADPAFETALPDLDDAQMALWIDVDALAGGLLGIDGAAVDEADAERHVAEHIAGIGVTAGYEDSGNATFRVRVVAD